MRLQALLIKELNPLLNTQDTMRNKDLKSVLICKGNYLYVYHLYLKFMYCIQLYPQMVLRRRPTSKQSDHICHVWPLYK